MAEQDFSEIAKLSERFNKDPKSRIFVQLADAYRKNSMVDEALQVISQGLQHHPEYPLAYLILGKCYYDKRQYGQAKEALEKTLRFDPQNIVAMRLLAQICEGLKDEVCQLMAYKGIVGIDPFDQMAKEKLVSLESRQKKGPVFTLTLAEEYEKQGNLTEALKVYEQLQFTDPTDLVLKEKVKEIKRKILQPGQEADLPAAEKTAIPAAPLEIASMADIMKDVQGTLEPSPPEIKIDKIEPVFEKPVIDKPITSDMDFVMERPKEKAPPVVEPVIPVIEPEPPNVEPKAGEPPPPESALAPEPAPSEEPEEILTLDEFLVDAPKAEEAAPVKEAELPVGETLAAEKKAEDKIETIESLLVTEPQPLKLEPAVDTVPAVEPELKAEPVIEEKIEPTAVPVVPEAVAEHSPPTTSTVESYPEEKTTDIPATPPLLVEEKKAEVPDETPPAEKKAEATAEEKKEKPKEEDFKSFQDWLSGLLK